MNHQERGARAEALARDSVFTEALGATRDWAMSKFKTAASPEEAWRARQLADAVEEFSGYLLAAIQMGKKDIDDLVAARDRQSARKKARQSEADYLNAARIARKEYANSVEGVAK